MKYTYDDLPWIVSTLDGQPRRYEPRTLSEYRAQLYGDLEPDRTLAVRGYLFLVLLVMLVATVVLFVTGYLPAY